ncbi:hypothetical protein EYF80_024313 [Liparis tanakae]|uniref:Uncharacterized protein n=1 Tax=Liparis tanakae TaxID=230148 RepID=A0A4Z2HKN9_9TELE|nr:hypothetical protein EYF80_024313 [Liparis tanakae]
MPPRSFLTSPTGVTAQGRSTKYKLCAFDLELCNELAHWNDISIQSTPHNSTGAQMSTHPNNEGIWRKGKVYCWREWRNGMATGQKESGQRLRLGDVGHSIVGANQMLNSHYGDAGTEGEIKERGEGRSGAASVGYAASICPPPGEANSIVSAKAVHNSAEQKEVGRTTLDPPAPWDVGTQQTSKPRHGDHRMELHAGQ